MLPSVGLDRSNARFTDDLQSLIGKYAGIWRDCNTEVPALDEQVSTASQRRNERETDLLIDAMEKELRNYPGSRNKQEAWRERVFKQLRQLGADSFHYPDRHLNIIFSPAYLAATREFVRQARAFDGAMDAASLGQALRNVWVMNCLQMFLGCRPFLSPSVFAYSMLYPYTDNYLDDPRLGQDAKDLANYRLNLRLSAEVVEPHNPHEAAVFRLIEKIESEYPRNEFPEVYSSLLAIHAGQVKSLRQQGGSCMMSPETLLQISVEKGGSSVLADSLLVAGHLNQTEADFFFGLGVMLQLLDDVQDLPEDQAAGHWTLFTHAATQGSLDSLTSRLWHFLDLVLDSEDCFTSASGLELKDLIRCNSRMLLLRAIADSANYFSCDYLCHMESRSPLSFSYLRDRRKAAEQSFARIWPQLARRRRLMSVFDLVG